MRLAKDELNITIKILEALDSDYPQSEIIEVNILNLAREGYWKQAMLISPINKYMPNTGTDDEINAPILITRIDLRSYILFLKECEKETSSLHNRSTLELDLNYWQMVSTIAQRTRYASLYLEPEDFYALRLQERSENPTPEPEFLEAKPEEKDEISYGVINAPPIPNPPISKPLREWWHEVLRNNKQYNCYGILLAFPSDGEIRNYLNHYWRELDMISGNHCLIIVLTEIGFMRIGVDDNLRSMAINEHVEKGYSLSVAELLNIKYDEFPCLVLFNDIRSSDFTIIKLEGLDVQEISFKLRVVFSIIKEAVSHNQKPLEAIKHYWKMESIRKARKQTASKIFNFAENTFEKVLESWITNIATPKHIS